MKMKSIAVAFAGVMLSASAAYADCRTTGCTANTSCQFVSQTNSYACVQSNPTPEMEVMMIPAAMGVAGLLAYRARKKAQKKAA